ncbi:ATP-binding protein [Oxalobacteraceae bacterium]|nr:ATP-binding protein [Oxalobacteraceae bacterium]
MSAHATAGARPTLSTLPTLPQVLELLALELERWLRSATRSEREAEHAGAEPAPQPQQLLALHLPPLPATLARLGEHLRLSAFEQGVLLLAAAPDLDPRFKSLLARAHGDAATPWLTLGLAMRCLPDAHWEAVTPAGRLRRWQLLELSGAASALDARLVLDETILHRLAGCAYADPRLEPWFRRLGAETLPNTTLYQDALTASLQAVAAEWQAAASLEDAAVLRIAHSDAGWFVRLLGAYLQLQVVRLSGQSLPGPADCERLCRLWEREAVLSGAMLWIDSDTVNHGDTAMLADLVDRMQSLVVVTGSVGLPLQRSQFARELPGSSVQSRLLAWQDALGDQAAAMNGQLGSIAEQFQLSPIAIRRLARSSITSAGKEAGRSELAGKEQGGALWQACRLEARRGLETLAARVESRASWDDLVLPDAAMDTLRTIAAQVRQRTRVYREWGFAERGERGLGISVMFAGGSGTGKTMAAEVLANELGVDLYRIDLSVVQSKWIGEAQKMMARCFDAGDASGAILLFDEADALFGKRSEVKDSHDRYANLEVSYLLQRLETYRGLAILTTNLKQSIDSAFQRRLRFVVQFPFPDADARAALWQRAFPQATPTDALDVGKLARLSLTGGHIRNVALNAAFLAADAGAAVSMRHLRQAVQAEFSKLDQGLPGAEVEDWL